MAILDKVFGKKPEGADAQSQEEKDLCSYVKSRVEDVRQSSARVAQEATWLRNSAYLMGFDSVYWDTTMKQFRPINNKKRPLNMDRIHVNKILPTVQTRLAKLCKNPPKYEVLPQSTSSEDKDAARLGLQILNMLWDRLEMNQKRIPLMMWLMQAGHSYLHVYWDSAKGKLITNPLTGEKMFEGDVAVDVESPFGIFSDPLATTDEHATWKVRAKVRRLSYFKDNFERGHMVKEESAWLLSTQYEQQLATMNSVPYSSGGAPQTLKNSAIELTYYEKPCRKYPRGRKVITANGVLLENDELPVGKIPLVKFDDIVIAGKFFPEAIITHLIPIQDQYNDLLRRRQQWVRRLLNGKIIAARNSGLSEEQLTNDSGEVVYYDPVPNAEKPTDMAMPNIPAYAYKEEESLDQQFNEVSGINDPSKGQMPSSSIPAIGMQMLVEADDTRMGIETEQHEIAFAKAGNLILEYIQEGYQTTRLLKTAGDNLEYAVEEFKGADLRGNTDVIVKRGSTLPGSKTLNRQEIVNAFQMGLLGDPTDPFVRQKVWEQMEYAFTTEAWSKIARTQAQIKRDIEAIEAGEVPQVHELDDHQAFINKLNEIRISDKFEKYPPEVQQAFNNSIEMHIQAQMRLTSPKIAAEEKVDEEMKSVQQEIAQNPELQSQLGEMSDESEPNMIDQPMGMQNEAVP